MSYRSYMSYRDVLWHVVDVPGVQGKVEVWKLRGLEVWLSQRPHSSRACRALSVLCSPGRAGAPSPYLII